MNFKYPLPPGQLLEYYKGRLYVAADDILYCGDPYSDYYDGRHGVYQFEGFITLLRAVEGGLYVADGHHHFLRGDSPMEFSLVKNIIEGNAIIYTDAIVDGQYIGGKEGITPTRTQAHTPILEYAIWTSTIGVIVGDPQGAATLVSDQYAMQYAQYRRGACLIKKDNGKEQYIGVLTI